MRLFERGNMCQPPRSRLPHCRNELANWLFHQFIFCLIKNIHGVYIVDNLRDPWNTRTKLNGLIANNCIYLDSSQNLRQILNTFIHELSHAAFQDVEEKEILRV